METSRWTDGIKVSKLALAERVTWVYENEERILAAADDPFGDLWWTEADQPIQFLAACREWAGWLREGEGFMSSLPIALDGSCSGTQHFSMAFRDEIGGAAVNLVPADMPSDIYTLVMNQGVERLEEIAAGNSENAEVARQWLASELLIRPTFKRPTMTFSYGSVAYGFRDQIMEDTLRPAFKAHREALTKGQPTFWPFESDGYKAATLLSMVTYTAVSAVVQKAAEAMRWLQEVSKVVTREGLPVRWTTPDGFPVVQHYRDMTTHRIDTTIAGTRIRANIKEDTLDIHKRKQASSFPPNYRAFPRRYPPAPHGQPGAGRGVAAFLPGPRQLRGPRRRHRPLLRATARDAGRDVFRAGRDRRPCW